MPQLLRGARHWRTALPGAQIRGSCARDALLRATVFLSTPLGPVHAHPRPPGGQESSFARHRSSLPTSQDARPRSVCDTTWHSGVTGEHPFAGAGVGKHIVVGALGHMLQLDG